MKKENKDQVTPESQETIETIQAQQYKGSMLHPQERIHLEWITSYGNSLKTLINDPFLLAQDKRKECREIFSKIQEQQERAEKHWITYLNDQQLDFLGLSSQRDLELTQSLVDLFATDEANQNNFTPEEKKNTAIQSFVDYFNPPDEPKTEREQELISLTRELCQATEAELQETGTISNPDVFVTNIDGESLNSLHNAFDHVLALVSTETDLAVLEAFLDSAARRFGKKRFDIRHGEK